MHYVRDGAPVLKTFIEGVWIRVCVCVCVCVCECVCGVLDVRDSASTCLLVPACLPTCTFFFFVNASIAPRSVVLLAPLLSFIRLAGSSFSDSSFPFLYLFLLLLLLLLFFFFLVFFLDFFSSSLFPVFSQFFMKPSLNSFDAWMDGLLNGWMHGRSRKDLEGWVCSNKMLCQDSPKLP